MDESYDYHLYNIVIIVVVFFSIFLLFHTLFFSPLFVSFTLCLFDFLFCRHHILTKKLQRTLDFNNPSLASFLAGMMHPHPGYNDWISFHHTRSHW
eukprot:m.78649 g.78649  ORF g.78649 m.78649 type:complete len:96 (+) comp8582_c1_seq5:1142-1429(+)